MKSARLTVDGHSYDVEEGATILRALDTQGALGGEVEIPRLCWHPALEVADACGTCAVEIEGEPELALACSAVVQDGMVVRTASALVLDARRDALAERLAGHPAECSTCEKIGECDLARLAWRFGPVGGVPVREPATLPRCVELGSGIRLDRALCIGCLRCVAFTRDVSGDAVIRPAKDGDRQIVAVKAKKPLKTRYAQNLVELCPVGALQHPGAAARARSFEMRAFDGICGGCARGCNVHVDVARGRVARLRARRNDEVNRTWLCDAGRGTVAQITRPDRVGGAQVRDGRGALTRVPIGDAAAFAGEALLDLIEREGAGVIAGVVAGHATNEALLTLAELLEAIGAPAPMLCVPRGDADAWLIHEEKAANAAGARALGFEEVQDVAATAAERGLSGLIVFGSDALIAEGDALSESLEALDLLILVDHRPSPVLRVADVVLSARLLSEKEGSVTSCDGRVQRVGEAAPPPVLSWDEGDLVHALGRALGLDAFGIDYDPADASRRLAVRVPAFAGLAPSDLPRTGARMGSPERTVK